MQHLSSGCAIPLTPLAARVMRTSRFIPAALPTGAASRQEQESLLAEEWSQCCARLGVPPALITQWWGVILAKYNEPQRAYHTVNHLFELFYQYYRVVGTYNYGFDDDMVAALAVAEERLARLAGDKPATGPNNAPSTDASSSLFVKPSSGASASVDHAPSFGQYLSAPFMSPMAIVLTIFFHDIIYDPKAASGVNEEASALLFERFCRECEGMQATNKAAVYDAQLRNRALAMANRQLDEEEAEAVRADKVAAEVARRRGVEMLNAGAVSRQQQQAMEEEAVSRTKAMRDNAVMRRLERSQALSTRFVSIYAELLRTEPFVEGSSASVCVVPRAVEDQVMLMIRATKNHTATAASQWMEKVRHPAMVAVEDNSDFVLEQRKLKRELAAQQQNNGPTDANATALSPTLFSVTQLSQALFPQHQTHCIAFAPSVDTDLGLFLDMDLSIVGVADQGRYDSYGEQIRHEYIHYPSRDYRSGRTAILKRFLDHTAPDSPQPLFKTPLYRYWCDVNAASNLSREITSLGVPELRVRTITIGDAPKVGEFLKQNYGVSASPPVGGGGGLLTPSSGAALPPPTPVSAAGVTSSYGPAAPPTTSTTQPLFSPAYAALSGPAASYYRLSPIDLQYLAGLNFEYCLMLRVEDEAEMMNFLEMERVSGATAAGRVGAAAPAPIASLSGRADITARVEEVSRAAPPIAAVVFTSLTNDPSPLKGGGINHRAAQDFCGKHLVIHSIVVHRLYRGRGVGSKLLRALANKARLSLQGGASLSPIQRVIVTCPELPWNVQLAMKERERAALMAGTEEGSRAGPATPTAVVSNTNVTAMCVEQSIQNFFLRNGFTKVAEHSVFSGGGGLFGSGMASGGGLANQKSNLQLVEMAMPIE